VATITEPELPSEPAAPDHPVAHRLRELIQAATEERVRQEQAEAEAARAEEDQWSELELSALSGETELDAFQELSEQVLEGHVDELDDAFETVPYDPLPAYEVEAIVNEVPPPVLPLITPAPPVMSSFAASERLDLEPSFGKARPHPDEDPSAKVMVAIEGVLNEVRKGTLSPAQVSAITGLVEAVTQLVEARRS
jgi:hypothetical protein